jgi:pyridoxal phosphate enzyme (YggS family)
VMEEITKETIRVNFIKVVEQIEKAACSVGRETSSVRLEVVTKGHPVEAVRAAVEVGARLFGENYVEEAAEKIVAFRVQTELEWHMIGHVQSRKARAVCEHFQWVESLDSLKLALRLDRFAGELGHRLPVLLECNVSGEETKFGFPAWQAERWPELREAIQAILALTNLEVRGLMTMAPYFDQPEPARPYFRRLAALRDRLVAWFPEVHWDELSMGMSGDFPVAVEEGATLLRIGTAIMGPRIYKT